MRVQPRALKKFRRGQLWHGHSCFGRRDTPAREVSRGEILAVGPVHTLKTPCSTPHHQLWRVYLLVVPPLWGSVSQILTLLIGPMDGARGRGRRRARRGRSLPTEPKKFFVQGLCGWTPLFRRGGQPPPAPMFRRDGRNFFSARGCNYRNY